MAVEGPQRGSQPQPMSAFDTPRPGQLASGQIVIAVKDSGEMAALASRVDQAASGLRAVEMPEKGVGDIQFSHGPVPKAGTYSKTQSVVGQSIIGGVKKEVASRVASDLVQSAVHHGASSSFFSALFSICSTLLNVGSKAALVLLPHLWVPLATVLISKAIVALINSIHSMLFGVAESSNE